MTIKIITDGAADLPLSFIHEHDITIVPLIVRFGEQSYKTGIDIDPTTFYKMMRVADELPKTSCPSPYDFFEVYKNVPETEDILVFTLSSGLSGTYESALMAMNMLLEEHPTRNIAVIDTKTGSCGQTLLINEAVQFRKNGASFNDIIAIAQSSIPSTKTYILLETLENVIKGGRLSKAKGAIANALNIKLILEVSKEGTIEVLEKVRGEKKARRRFIELIGESSFNNEVLTMTHSHCEEKANQLLKDIQETYHCKDTIISEIGPLIGTYAGEGGIVISFNATS